MDCQGARRTGRAGRKGDAISFVTPREQYLLKHIEKATRQPLTAAEWACMPRPCPALGSVLPAVLQRF